MKINFLFILLFAGIFSQAQSLKPEGCIPITVAEDIVLGDMFYGDNDFFYFTINKTAKSGKYVTNTVYAISKYDRNMKLVATLPLNELMSGASEHVVLYSPKIIDGNFVIVMRDVIGKYSSYGSNDHSYHTVVLNKDLKIIVPAKEFRQGDKKDEDDPRMHYSADSTHLLLTFDKWTSSTNMKQPDIEKTFLVFNKNGEKITEQKVTLTGKPEYYTNVQEILFDNKNIYFTCRAGLSKKYWGVSPKSGEKAYNTWLYKYNIQTSTLSQLGAESELSEHFIPNCILSYNNNSVYLAGTISDDPSLVKLTTNQFDNAFILAIDANEKVTISNFNPANDPGPLSLNRGIPLELFFKQDGGAYLYLENEYCASFCNADEIIIYNFDKLGNSLWKKVIPKEHHGAKYFKEINYMYTTAFVNNNALYFLFNESKENALSALNTPFKKFNGWDKELYCLSYIINNNGEMIKKSLFGSETYGCKFFSNSTFVYRPAKKLYSLGTEKMVVISYE